jgi:hypothetical protein
MTLVLDSPFVWPEPMVLAGQESYETYPPFTASAKRAVSIFGMVASPTADSVRWVEGLLADNPNCRVLLILGVWPACGTTEMTLRNLVGVAARSGGRAAFHVFPETAVCSRPSNVLCLCRADGDADLVVGPTDNLGFPAATPSQMNLVCPVDAATLERVRRWFDYLWCVSGPVSEATAAIPCLALPEGQAEAHALWEDYRANCLALVAATGQATPPHIDPATGELVEAAGGNQPIPSPTESIGVQTLHPLLDRCSRLLELGSLVTIDKGGRVPPLEAPVRPAWFGVESFRQTGVVTATTAIKVAPFDEVTLKKINRLLRASGELLPRFSFALADGVRWMPTRAVQLFEAALAAANNEAKKAVAKAVRVDPKNKAVEEPPGEAFGDRLASFLAAQRERIRDDAQSMYSVFHPGTIIPESAVREILAELERRLGKAGGETLLPKVSYSRISMKRVDDGAWSSPWGQALMLLKGIAEFPRTAMTDRYFWRGLQTNEDALIAAMNIAEDSIVPEYGSRRAVQRAETELDAIKALDDSAAHANEKCSAIWAIIQQGNCGPALALANEHTKTATP